MEQLILSLNLSAAILTLFYIVHLLGELVQGDDAMRYLHVKRSLLNQQIRRRA